MQAIIQILKVNALKTGVKDGRNWEMQDAECLILRDDFSPDQVGVLPIPKLLRGTVEPGTYTGSFSLRADLRSRRIEAVLTGLNKIPPKSMPAASAGAAK